MAIIKYADIESPTKPKAKAKTLAKAEQVAAPHTIAKQKVKRGRPRIEDKGTTLSDTKPWVALGMCRRTWEKRQREAKP